MATSGTKRTVIVAIGDKAAPIAGVPAYCGQFRHSAYQVAESSGAVVAQLPFGGVSADAVTLYTAGWGVLLHANGAETAENTAVGFDNLTSVATTTTGGYMVYHVLASSLATHTAAIEIEEADTNLDGSFAALTGATTGVITVKAGVSGIVALTPTATVKQFLRWQLTLGTATSVTFCLAFMRG